ncbi:MAG TPA: LuxR C-terminal-related transcriptional regulator [Solirubrobacterales bacterium]|nr:LuxR C-terminal-related transcriptional regulator [Solirubrobacterales bacterium]
MPARSALLDRDEELAAIQRMLQGALDEAGAVLLIEGEAGAGKTALLDAAGGQGEEEEMHVLRARAGEFERDFPYGVVRQLFEPLLVAPGKYEGLLDGNGAAAAPVFDPAAAPPEGGNPFAIQHGLYCLVLALAESSPLLILVDDAQWGDLASLRALAYVGRRLGGLRVALGLTIRTGEPGEHEALLDELRQLPGALRIKPRPLSSGAVAALFAGESERSGQDGFAVAARDATGGNPFLLVELVRALDFEQLDGEPVDADRLAQVAGAGASRTMLTRLTRHGEDAVAVARAVAVLEPNAEARWIAQLGGVPSATVADACERLILANLLSDSRPVGFVHPLVRAAVLSEMPELRRAAEHGKAARLLAEDGAAADAVAAHLLLAEPAGEGWVVAQLRSAGAQALARGAPAAAVSYVRRALREPPPRGDRAAVSRELGRALLLADEPEGIEVLRAVRSALDDPLERAAIATELSVSLAFRRPGREGVTLLEESLEEIPDAEAGVALLIRGHMLIHTLSGLEEVPPQIMWERENWPDGDTQEGRFLLRQLSFLFALGLGPVEYGLELATRAGTDLEAYAEDVRAGVPAQYVFMAQTLADRGDLIWEPIAVGIEASERRGAIPAIGSGYGVRGYCRYLDGDLFGAAADLTIARRLLTPIGLLVPTRQLLAVAMRIAIVRGELDDAQEMLDDLGQSRPPGTGVPGALVLLSRAELRAASGRHAEARHDFIAAGERVGWLPYANPEALGWRIGLALSESALGNGEEARRLATDAVRLAREAGGRRGIGLTLKVLGMVSPGEEGIELLRDASATLAGTRARLRQAEALVELGAALRRANRRREAREPLREGLDLAHRCGARILEDRARVELKATGARPRKAVLSGVDSLTPSELRVARMAAEGMTNREIAQGLFITAKTVETHLRHVYQKLDVARTGLANALDGEHP